MNVLLTIFNFLFELLTSNPQKVIYGVDSRVDFAQYLYVSTLLFLLLVVNDGLKIRSPIYVGGEMVCYLGFRNSLYKRNMYDFYMQNSLYICLSTFFRV